MRASRVAVILWVGLIFVLLIVELAEITHLFTLPVQSALSDPLAFLSGLVFTTLLALVGAIFIGVYISHRLLSPTGFTPFEEEMLQMRSDLRELKRDVAALRGGDAADPPAQPTADTQEQRP